MNKNSLYALATAILISAPIYGQTQAPATTTIPHTIKQRKENQQDRIAQGVKSGQLTPGETAKLEKKEQGINREEKGMREANGGKLTKVDRAAIRQQQNHVSKNIYRKKHNTVKS